MSDVRRAANTNVVAEQAVLGAMIQSTEVYWKIADTLRSDFFTIPVHRDIFAAIKEVNEAGQRVTRTLLEAKLPEADANGTMVSALIATLVATAGEVGNVVDYADQIAEMANRRRCIAVANRLLKEAQKGEMAALDLAAEAEMALLDIMHVSAPRRPRRLSDAVKRVVSQAAEAFRDKDFRPGLNTGIGAVDEILGLILPGDAGYIMSSQGDGKSAIAAQIGMHNAKAGLSTLMFQFEMSDEQVAARELAAASGLSVAKINEGSFDAFEYDMIQDALPPLQHPEFWILDAPGMTVRQMKSHALGLKRTVGLGLVIIDQLDKVKAEGRHRDRFERFTEITGDIKVMAKELQIPIITLAQRTRGAQRRDDPTPAILDADAPSIERDADWVLGLWRQETYLMLNKPGNRGEADWDKWKAALFEAQGKAEIICLKRRRGKAFEQRKLKWEGHITRFSDLE